MNRLHFDTLAQPASSRVDFWGHINQDFFGRLGVACLDDGPLDGQFSAYQVGPLRMFQIAAPAHRISRDRSNGELPIDDFYKLVLQLRGHAEIRQHDRAFHLRSGDWSLYDPRVPYSITNFERTELLAVQVPSEQLKGFKVTPLHTSEAHSSALTGLYAVLSSYLTSLSEQLLTLPDSVGQPLSETVLGLLASTLSQYQDDANDHTTLPAVMKARVKQYVRMHLREPDLSIDRIAQELRCSKRYLHRVFEDEDCTLERYIWQTRLERCQAALQAPSARGKSIAEIAYGWGFNSSAHFCRMFKSHFGVPPTEFLRQAAQ
jgi:AraC-like DNA-binding protein